MRYSRYNFPNRYICDVLDEIRKCHETRNYSFLLGLVEECQTLANRMEAKLSDYSDIEYMLKEKNKLKKEIQKLEEKKDELED